MPRGESRGPNMRGPAGTLLIIVVGVFIVGPTLYALQHGGTPANPNTNPTPTIAVVEESGTITHWQGNGVQCRLYLQPESTNRTKRPRWTDWLGSFYCAGKRPHSYTIKMSNGKTILTVSDRR